jgi:AraC-like DNA-binding protein
MTCARLSRKEWSVMPEFVFECVMCRRTGRGLLATPAARSACLGDIGTPAADRGKPARRIGFPTRVSRQIEEFVGARLEARVDIAQLAANFGCSSSHFFRMFRRTFGITPHTYVMRRRMALAQDLLTGTDLRLAEVALRAGFCDQSHLSRSFRQFAGLPPRAFRAQHRVFAHEDATVASTP